MKKTIFLLLGCLLIASPAWADDDSAGKKTGETVKKGGAAAGRGIEKGVDAAGRGLKKGAKATGKGLEKAGKWLQKKVGGKSGD